MYLTFFFFKSHIAHALSRLELFFKTLIHCLCRAVPQEGRDKRFLIQKLCQAQKISVVRSPGSNSQPRRSSSSYHTSFSNNFNESVFLAHPPPDSATHV